MHRPLFFSILSLAVVGILANVYPINPDELPAGSTQQITWTDDGEAPSLEEVGTIQILLYTGAVRGQTYLATLAEDVPATQEEAEVNIDRDLGVSGPYYWLRFRRGDPHDDVFTRRFAVTRLTGSFNDTVLEQLQSNSQFQLPSSLVNQINSEPSPSASANATGTSDSNAAGLPDITSGSDPNPTAANDNSSGGNDDDGSATSQLYTHGYIAASFVAAFSAVAYLGF